MMEESDSVTKPRYTPVGPVMRLTELSASAFGLTKKAIERRIERATWLEGAEYHRSPDGQLWLDVKGIERWVVTGRASR